MASEAGEEVNYPFSFRTNSVHISVHESSMYGFKKAIEIYYFGFPIFCTSYTRRLGASCSYGDGNTVVVRRVLAMSKVIRSPNLCRLCKKC